MRKIPENMGDRLIVALDMPFMPRAFITAAHMLSIIKTFKIGPATYFSEDCNTLIKTLQVSGADIFMDAKLYDTPGTVTEAVKQIGGRGCTFVTVHARWDVMEAAMEGARAYPHLKVLGITQLTSDNLSPVNKVAIRAEMAMKAGLHGFVCSAWDEPVQSRMTENTMFDDMLIVTPGIRPPGSKSGQHHAKRVATPGQAIMRGADYIVVGEPITKDSMASAVAVGMIDAMERAARSMKGKREGGISIT